MVKKLREGSPNAVDLIRAGDVAVVINTGYSGTALRDGFHIRRAAVERGIPCFTSLDTVRALVEALEKREKGYQVATIGQYRRGLV